MEAKIRYPSTLNCKFTGFTDGHGLSTCTIREDKRGIESADFGIAGKYLQSIPRQRDCSGLTILGLTKREHSSFQVHI